MLGRRREVRRMMRRRRRRVMVAGAVVVGATSSMVKMSQADADKIQQTTGKAPEDMDEQELQQAMQQTGVQAQPVTDADQQAMAAAESADPEQG
jgi:hypothetical protein